MKRTALSFIAMLSLLLLVLGTSGAAGGPNKPGQDPIFEPAPQEFTLVVGDEIRIGRGLVLQAVQYNGAVGAYFRTDKYPPVFFANGEWVLGLELPEGDGKVFVGQGGDEIKFLVNPATGGEAATKCRVSSSRGGALCRPKGAVTTGACMMEVADAARKLNFIRFGPVDSEGNGAFERCAP